MRKFIGTVVAAMVVLGSVSAGADTIALFENDNISGGPSSTPVDVEHGDVTVGDLALGPGLASTPWNDSLASFGHNLTADLAGAITANDYFSFTVTPDAGMQVSYSSLYTLIAVNTGDTNVGGSIHFTLMSDVGGFTAGSELGTFEASQATLGTSGAADNPHTYDLTGASALQGVSSAVEFRLYAHDGFGVQNRMGIGHIFFDDGADDLRLEGTVTVIPEPASAALLGFAGLVALLARKLRG